MTFPKMSRKKVISIKSCPYISRQDVPQFEVPNLDCTNEIPIDFQEVDPHRRSAMKRSRRATSAESYFHGQAYQLDDDSIQRLSDRMVESLGARVVDLLVDPMAARVAHCLVEPLAARVANLLVEQLAIRVADRLVEQVAARVQISLWSRWLSKWRIASWSP